MYYHSFKYKILLAALCLVLMFSAAPAEILAEGEEAPAQEPVANNTTISTGDAVAVSDTENTVNTNNVDTTSTSEPQPTPTPTPTPEPTPTDTGSSDVATTTPETVSDDTATTTPTTLTIDDSNSADVGNESESSADTGSNTATDNATSTVSVDTGDAYAVANVANIVNSNFINSDGFIKLLNSFGSLFGDVSMSFDTSLDCGLNCPMTYITSQNQNLANLLNSLFVRAATGLNTANSNGGNVDISTGNAYAAANVINIVNTNVIDANYLGFIMNSFGSWEGDLVLPSASDFEQSGCTGCIGSANINNNSEADINNGVITNADTGNNTANENAGGSSISTGSALSDASVMTVANTNIFGENAMLVIVRTFGKWSGRIFSLPDGVTMTETPNGFVLNGFDFASGGASSGGSAAGLNIMNNNMASIENNIDVSADTGSNTANSNGGITRITTGNAYSAANILNIANTNIVGRNWLLAIVNIFGNWDGDIAFGRPDLWIGESAVASSNIVGPDTTITYTYTYRNNGNAPATRVRIIDRLAEYTFVTGAGGGDVSGDNQISWDLGTLRPGETSSVTYTVGLNQGRIPYGTRSLVNNASIEAYEQDANSADNVDTLAIEFSHSRPTSNTNYSSNTPWPDLQIEKKRKGTGIVLPGSRVDYVIKLWNQGPGSAFDVIVDDIMTNASSTIINKQTWNLGEVFPHEEILFEYTVQIATSTPAGFYTNKAIGHGFDVHQAPVTSVYGTQTIEVGELQQTPIVSSSPAISTDNTNSVASTTPTELVLSTEDLSNAVAAITNIIDSASITPASAGGSGEITKIADELSQGLQQQETRTRDGDEQGLNNLLAMVATLPFIKQEYIVTLYLALAVLFLLLFLVRRHSRE